MDNSLSKLNINNVQKNFTYNKFYLSDMKNIFYNNSSKNFFKINNNEDKIKSIFSYQNKKFNFDRFYLDISHFISFPTPILKPNNLIYYDVGNQTSHTFSYTDAYENDLELGYYSDTTQDLYLYNINNNKISINCLDNSIQLKYPSIICKFKYFN